LYLTGHTKAVWSVVSIGDATNDSKIILTAGADHSIIAWKNYTQYQTFQGKTDLFKL